MTENDSAGDGLHIPDEMLGYAPLTKTADDIDIVNTPPVAPGGQHQAVVRDIARQRAWSGEGPTADKAGTEALKKFLTDRHSSEYVGKR